MHSRKIKQSCEGLLDGSLHGENEKNGGIEMLYLISIGTNGRGLTFEYHLIDRKKDMRCGFCRKYEKQTTTTTALLKAVTACGAKIKDSYSAERTRVLIEGAENARNFVRIIKEEQ